MKKYKILLIGNGGREHAIAWKLLQSKKLEHLYCTNYNLGFRLSPNITILNLAHHKIAACCLRLNIDLVIIGPEQPIFNGLADQLRSLKINVLAPSRHASMLEASKIYAKNFMSKYNIDKAEHKIFTDKTKATQYCIKHFNNQDDPLVLKLDEPALGKGVTIIKSLKEAKKYLNKNLVIEQYLKGKEISYFILCDGAHYIDFGYARDYKTLYDNNCGPNTGGMGSYSAKNLLTSKQLLDIKTKIITPTIEGLKQENIEYIGILFFGIMLTSNGPKLLEYNVRLGDPETQTLLLRLKSDLCELFYQAATGNLPKQIKWYKKHAVNIVLTNKGYPYKNRKNLKLELDQLYTKHKYIKIFYANILRDKHSYRTNGGRLLSIASIADNKEKAIKLAYEAIGDIKFKHGTYRRDIGT